jgi:hypothetical protein
MAIHTPRKSDNMIKTSAAYSKLATILGSRLVNRRRTIHEEGQPAKSFSETLLLIPKPKASAMGVSGDAEVYIDKTTKEEFIAIRVSATTPRNKVRVPVVPPNPLMEWRAVLGQGGYHEDKAFLIICPTHDVNCHCKELMAKASVKIIQICPLSQFKYGQVVSKLDAYEENQRIGNAFFAIRKAGCTTPAWSHFLQFVPATEADSILLVSHDGDDIKIQISATQCFAYSPIESDASIHSTIPVVQKPALPNVLRLSQQKRDALAREFDVREPK